MYIYSSFLSGSGEVRDSSAQRQKNGHTTLWLQLPQRGRERSGWTNRQLQGVAQGDGPETVVMGLAGRFLSVRPAQALTTCGTRQVFPVLVPWIPCLSSGDNKGTSCIGFCWGKNPLSIIIEQVSTNYSRWAKPSKPPVFVNKA